MAAGVCRFHLQSSLAGRDHAPRSRSRSTARGPKAASRRVIRPLIRRPGAAPEGDLAIEELGGGNAYLADEEGGDGGAGNGSGGSGGQGGGGGDEGGHHEGMPGALTAALMAAGRTVESLPAGFAAAVREGKASREALELFLKLERNPLMRPFLGIAGFRERLLADPGFFVKLGIELGIGLVCKITAEAQKRGESFKSELDFVFANVVMALIADFMLVWLPAPTLSYAAKKAGKQGKLASFLASCPDNAFQVVPAGKQPWSLAQRGAAVGRNGVKLLGVGFGASMFGVTITNVLLEIRKKLDPEFISQNPPQNVLAMSGAYAAYMASSSNLRYQILAGVVEERGVERLLHGNALACGVASFVVRTGNTFLGSLLWVDFLRLVGLQKKTETAKK